MCFRARAASWTAAAVLATGCGSTDTAEAPMSNPPLEQQNHGGQENLATILDLWDFGDPGGTAQRMLAERDAATARGDVEFAAELTTQVARARGLGRDFVDANALLDGVEAQLDERGDTVRVRYLLERGRVLNTSGDPEASRPFFTDAWDLARNADADYLAVDAAHMLGIVTPAEERLQWNLTAIDHAETCGDEDARRWLGSLYNNTAWTLHDGGEPAAALELFEKALALREAEGDADRTFIARWSVARCMRTLGRTTEALEMQRSLAADRERAGADPDGFVHEELGELLLLAGEDEAARDEFEAALPLLREVVWLRESDPARLERIEALALEE